MQVDIAQNRPELVGIDRLPSVSERVFDQNPVREAGMTYSEMVGGLVDFMAQRSKMKET